MPKTINDALEKAVGHNRRGVVAGVNFECGHYPDYGSILTPLGVQPLANCTSARFLVKAGSTVASSLKGPYDSKVARFKAFAQGGAWK